MYDEKDNPDCCNFCGAIDGVYDSDAIYDPSGICCGRCAHKMGLGENIISNCGLCQFPVLETPHYIDDDYFGYCDHCFNLLIMAGFTKE